MSSQREWFVARNVSGYWHVIDAADMFIGGAFGSRAEAEEHAKWRGTLVPAPPKPDYWRELYPGWAEAS